MSSHTLVPCLVELQLSSWNYSVFTEIQKCDKVSESKLRLYHRPFLAHRCVIQMRWRQNKCNLMRIIKGIKWHQMQMERRITEIKWYQARFTHLNRLDNICIKYFCRVVNSLASFGSVRFFGPAKLPETIKMCSDSMILHLGQFHVNPPSM